MRSFAVTLLLASVAACSTFLEPEPYTVHVPPGVVPPSRPADVRSAVLEWVSVNEGHVGRRAEPKVIAVHFVPANKVWTVPSWLRRALPSPTASVQFGRDTWVVEAQGTLVVVGGRVGTVGAVHVDPLTLEVLGGDW